MSGNQNPLDQINHMKSEDSRLPEQPSRIVINNPEDPGLEAEEELSQGIGENPPDSSVPTSEKPPIDIQQPATVPGREAISAEPVDKISEPTTPGEPSETTPVSPPSPITKSMTEETSVTASEPAGKKYHSQPQTGTTPSKYSIFHSADHSDAESIASHENKAENG